MTNLTSDIVRKYIVPPGGLNTRELKLTGYTNFEGGNTAYTVYKGALVFCDQSDADGYFRPVDSAVAVTTADIFGGVALENVAVTSANAADGSKKVTVAVDGTWAFPIGGLAITDMGAIAYASDDNTVTSDANDTLAIGVIVDADASFVWVDIGDFAGKLSATTT